MTGRMIFLIGTLTVAGVVTNVVPRAQGALITEPQMRDLLPSVVEGVRYKPGDTPGESYHMDTHTYEVLTPLGIVARTFERGKERYDTVVITGDTPDNFHDPTWCLPSQNWTLAERKESTVTTKAHGEIPISYFEATNGTQKMLVMYTYRGPTRFHAGINKLAMDLFASDFLRSKTRLGAFYRFLSIGDDVDIEKTKRFMADYLDAADTSSRGVF